MIAMISPIADRRHTCGNSITTATRWTDFSNFLATQGIDFYRFLD